VEEYRTFGISPLHQYDVCVDVTNSLGGRSTRAAGRIGIEDVEPGDRLIVAEGDASDEFTSLESQWRVGNGEVAGAHDVSVSVARVGPNQPCNLSPRFAKLLLGEPIAHLGIEAGSDLGPPCMSEIIDDCPGQICGPRKRSGIHDFSSSGINWLAVTLENGLTRYTENVADLLPRSSRLSCLLHGRGHQRASPVLNFVRRTHQLERIVLAPQNRCSENLAQLPVKLLPRRREQTKHMSRMS
jgi:hypothetical protein